MGSGLGKAGQSLNTAAIWTTTSKVFGKPELAIPTRVVRNVSEINWAKLQEQLEVKFVVFDKDNTITAPYEQRLHETVRESVQDCVDQFGKDYVAIYSNSAGTPDDKGLAWLKELESTTGLRVIEHQEKKPLGFESVLQHFQSACKTVVEPSAVLVVGDRLLTDTVFGNLHGAKTVHCMEPLQLKGDNKFAVIIRRLENQWLQSRLNLQ